MSTARVTNAALRQQLMAAISTRIEHLGLTQVQAAEWLGITAPRINLLLKGRHELFSVDALISIAKNAGLTVRLRLTRPYRSG
jgi:predicted XRE-type DNA-binding protein